MKATGIVRRIDDLGRVVIPKEVRRTIRIREGDPLEIYTGERGEVILKKYTPCNAQECAAILKGLYASVKRIEGVGKVAIYNTDDTAIDRNERSFPIELTERADICDEFQDFDKVYTIIGTDVVGYLVVEHDKPIIKDLAGNTEAILRELEY